MTLTKKEGGFYDLKAKISKESKIVKEISALQGEIERTEDKEEKKLINSQVEALQKALQKTNAELKSVLEKLALVAPLREARVERPMFKPLSTLTPPVHAKAAPAVPKTVASKPHAGAALPKISKKEKAGLIESVEKGTIKRLKKEEEKEEKERRKPKKKKAIGASNYVRLSNKFFGKLSGRLLHKGHFKGLKRNLVKANMQFLSKSYVSVIFFTTFLSAIISFFLFVFFLFYNFGVAFPFITAVRGSIAARALNIFWIFILLPVLTFALVYLYPVMEKKSIEHKIRQELPFATIHMSSIAESMVEPSNIFQIMVKTKEYPILEKEFTKLINEINVFGRDLVTALRNSAFNSPSKRLAELFDGLATTITSGGDLSDFFDKRAQSLLFEYKIEKEKKTKSAETFMDIYISVVIAAPMILMLLLIMMRVSGLGIALSTGMISLIMVLGVSFINIVFLVFLHLKGST
jgi:hypothetical protein